MDRASKVIEASETLRQHNEATAAYKKYTADVRQQLDEIEHYIDRSETYMQSVYWDDDDVRNMRRVSHLLGIVMELFLIDPES
jgi:hypothetical protein